MAEPPPLISIRKIPAGTFIADLHVNRWGRWSWTCRGADGFVGLGLGSQQGALREACRHLIAAFDQHHGESVSFPDGNRHYIACLCGWVCNNERTEHAAEYALGAHIEYAHKALTGITV